MNLKSFYKITTFLMLMSFVAVGCKSAKSISSNGELNEKLSAKQIIKESNKSNADFKTLVGKLKIDFTQKEKSQGTTVSFRMEKNKTIWMSKLGIAKILITPNRVAYFNKWDKTYFDGDFSLLSDLLGTELDFEKVQNILLGEAIFDLNKGAYKASAHEGSYVIQPKEQEALFEIFFLLNPNHFKMDSQQITQSQENRYLEVEYRKYQEVEKQKLPQVVKIIALDSGDETMIDLEYRSISLNEDLRFPFRIPSGYEEIILK